MIEKVVKIKNLNDNNSAADDLAYWRGKTPAERVVAVDS